MEIIYQIISILAQTAVCSYLTLSLAYIFTSVKYSNKQKLLTIFISCISTIACTLVKDLFPLSNTVLSWILMFINLKVVLKTSITKSFFVILSSFLLLGISELFIFFLMNSIFKVPSSFILENFYITILSTFLQLIISMILVKIISLFFSNFPNIKTFLHKKASKQLVLFVIISSVCILPQLLFFMINSYEYSWQILMFNFIQITLIGIVILFYFNNAFEKEQILQEKITKDYNNKNLNTTLSGFIEFKHELSNKFQSFIGCLQMKRYDILEESLYKLFREWGILNTRYKLKDDLFNEPLLYGVVEGKYNSAMDKNILMEIDVRSDMKYIQFPSEGLSRVIGILLDNAIEATLKLPEKDQYIKLEVKYDERRCQDIITVLNTYDTNIDIDLSKIYKRGYSSKEKKSGIGLWEITKIMSKVPYASIDTSIKDNKFIQCIKVERL